MHKANVYTSPCSLFSAFDPAYHKTRETVQEPRIIFTATNERFSQYDLAYLINKEIERLQHIIPCWEWHTKWCCRLLILHRFAWYPHSSKLELLFHSFYVIGLIHKGVVEQRCEKLSFKAVPWTKRFFTAAGVATSLSVSVSFFLFFCLISGFFFVPWLQIQAVNAEIVSGQNDMPLSVNWCSIIRDRFVVSNLCLNAFRDRSKKCPAPSLLTVVFSKMLVYDLPFSSFAFRQYSVGFGNLPARMVKNTEQVIDEFALSDSAENPDISFIMEGVCSEPTGKTGLSSCYGNTY